MTEEKKYQLQTQADQIRYERARRANTAERVGKMLSDLIDAIDSEAYSIEDLGEHFISKTLDDIAHGRITFEQGLTSLGIAVFSDTVKSPDFEPDMLTGSGWGIDASGTMELNTLRVRQRMEVLELLINRLQAIEGDAIYTEADAIERVEEQPDGSYNVYFKSKWDGYFTAISAGSVLKGIYNSLAAAALGGSTVVGTETPAAYYASWMLVRSVNQAANMANVSLYPDDECPGNANHAPCPLMTVARWGHHDDPTRQQCFYISSTEGRIVKLNHVDKPKLAANGVNHSMILGRITDWLYDWLDNKGYTFDRDHEEVVFGDVGVFRKIIQYTGDRYVEPNIIDKGPWQSGTAYLHAQLNRETEQVETWDCWHLGCRWRSMSEDNTSEPAWNNPTWAFIEGNPYFSLDFYEPEQLYDADHFSATLSVKALLHGIDVTADLRDQDVQWVRYSEDAGGTERTASDLAWVQAHAAAGKVLALTAADLDAGSFGFPRLIRFIATATLRDGVQASAAFEYPL